MQLHLKHVIEKFDEWGYELVKLDFLYANHFNPRFKTSEDPDELLYEYLISIRNMHKNLYTIACGSPLGPAIHAVDAIRISDDINFPQIRHIWPLNRMVASNRLKQLENNLKVRFSLSNQVTLDPDAFICHKSQGLSQVQILKLINLIKESKGVKFLGDDLTKLNDREVQTYIKAIFT